MPGLTGRCMRHAVHRRSAWALALGAAGTVWGCEPSPQTNRGCCTRPTRSPRSATCHHRWRALSVMPGLTGHLMYVARHLWAARFSSAGAAGPFLSRSVLTGENRKSPLAGYLPPRLLRDKEGPAGPGEYNPRELKNTLRWPNNPGHRPENNLRVLVASHSLGRYRHLLVLTQAGDKVFDPIYLSRKG